MKYFVAHLLGGDVKKYHDSLTRELAEKYRITPLHDRIPPHITIKAPFETDEVGIKDVERTLRSFAYHEQPATLSVRGFGRFGFRTVYMDVYRSQAAIDVVRRAITTLNANVPWMPTAPLEGNKLHASVARFLNRRQFRRVWRHVQELTPRFETNLDTIAILKKETRSWALHASIQLRVPDDVYEYSTALNAKVPAWLG